MGDTWCHFDWNIRAASLCITRGCGHFQYRVYMYMSALYFPLILSLSFCGATHMAFIGVPAGTVVVTNKAFNAFAKEEHELVSPHIHVYM